MESRTEEVAKERGISKSEAYRELRGVSDRDLQTLLSPPTPVHHLADHLSLHAHAGAIEASHRILLTRHVFSSWVSPSRRLRLYSSDDFILAGGLWADSFRSGRSRRLPCRPSPGVRLGELLDGFLACLISVVRTVCDSFSSSGASSRSRDS